MAQYAFGTDEYVVLNAQQVHIDTKKSFGIPRDSELMLTNRNIVFPIKGLTGKVKDYQVFPLSDIRIVDGKPQCRLDSSQFMEEKLEISTSTGIVRFVFGGVENKKERSERGLTRSIRSSSDATRPRRCSARANSNL